MKQSKLPYNSANRFLAILNKAHLIGKEHPELPVREVFASAMQTKRTPTAFYSAWSKLFYLIEQLKKDILQLPEVKSVIYIKAIQEIIKTISLVDLSRNWEGIDELNFTLNNPDWTGFHLLELCAIELGNKEMEITAEKLKNFQMKIETLFQEVHNSEMDLSVKFFLEEHLNEIKEKVENYHFYGSEGIKKSVQESLGALLFKNAEFAQIQESEQKLLQHFLKLLKYILDYLISVNLSLPEKVLDTLNLRIIQHSDTSV